MPIAGFRPFSADFVLLLVVTSGSRVKSGKKPVIHRKWLKISEINWIL